ncbi:hypothetical protein EYC80_005722 [Monilinia laxa]|uniref:Uncharacterized protein n=1 Tax=Monilinia laxa TaxID=61186 RepID=A0A5N6KEV2_MONLA|nr:hypothetical protein EYC80_005722 [Monilinia laxa]
MSVEMNMGISFSRFLMTIYTCIIFWCMLTGLDGLSYYFMISLVCLFEYVIDVYHSFADWLPSHQYIYIYMSL